MASIALLSWPLIGIIIYAFLGPVRGLIWSFLIGYLFLPEAHSIDLPGLPPFDKRTAVSVTCLFGIWAAWRAGLLPKNNPNLIETRFIGGIVILLTALFMLVPIATVVTNRAPIFFEGGYALPGLTVIDFRSLATSNIVLLVPFFAGCWLLFDPKHQRELLIALVITGLIYSLFGLVERRLSPQFSNWVYGYFPHQWYQHVRNGQFRPIVFLQHGLHFGFFMFTATMAGLLLALTEKTQTTINPVWYRVAAVWLFFILLISNNLGAVLIAISSILLLIFGRRRLRVWVLGSIAIILLLMPALRTANLVPIDSSLALAEQISSQRAASLEFRFVQEERFLERAEEKPMFGWGLWGRWRIHDIYGRDISTVDGQWIAIFGERGWLGYISYFGLLSIGLLWLIFGMRGRDIPPVTMGIAFIMAGNLAYMIPNAAGSTLSWLFAGILVGFVRWRPAAASETLEEEPQQGRSGPSYSRFARTVSTPR